MRRVALSVDRAALCLRDVRERFVQLVKARARGAKMLVNWHPGEEVQVDWAGRKLSLYSAGEVTPVSLFVARCLTATRPSCARAWRWACSRGLSTIRRCSRTSAARRSSSRRTTLQREWCSMRTASARSIRFTRSWRITTAPWSCPRGSVRPSTKAAVESHVRIGHNSIVGVLEQMRFTSPASSIWPFRAAGGLQRPARRGIQGAQQERDLRGGGARMPAAAGRLSSRPSPGGRSASPFLRRRGEGARSTSTRVPPRYADRRSPCIAEDAIEGPPRRQAAVHREASRRECRRQTFEGCRVCTPDRFSR